VNSSGVIATNYHVVYSAKEISVTLADEKIYNVTAIINYNTNRDFCLLKIDAENLPIAVLGNSDRLRPGEDIHAVAYLPYKKPTFSKGVFSGTEQFNNYNWLSSTIPLVPKGSGGPVINSQGEIIGMITMSIIDRVNLAVPINEIKPFISTIPKLTIEEFTKIIGGVIVYSQEGDLAYYRNDFEQAISNYNKGIEENPKFASLYGKRGIAYYNKGDFNKAISDFSKVIELDPKNFYAYNLRGHAYLDKDNYELSIVDSTKAIELRPKDSNSYNLRCVACLRINNFDQTISDCSKAIELDPYLAAAYHNRGIAYDNKGYTNQAISDFNKAIELDPTLSAAYYDRGLTYHRIGDIDKAIADYSKAIEINPYYVEAYGNRAGAYLGKHEYSKAWDDIHKRESLGGEIPPAFLKILKEESGREK
jgi:Flp pilus assembly protein TadD